VALCGALALVMAAVTSVHRASEPVQATVREAGPRPSQALLLLAAGAALATFGPNALGANLVGSAVDAGISEAGAGLAIAAGSAASLVVRVALGQRADRRSSYGLGVVAALLLAGSAGFALMASEQTLVFLIGTMVAFALGWGWPGLFNLSVVASHRGAPAAATGVTQTGIYVGAAAGPAVCGLLAAAFLLAARAGR
jgi:Na+/melibiose symporter-like transporter